MRTYTCDRCGFEAKHSSGIVGKEFEMQGFQTLAPAYRWGNVVDVCGPCFKVVQKAGNEANDEALRQKRQGFLSRLGIGGKS